MDKQKLDSMAEEIISASDGSFYMEYGEDFEKLSVDEQGYVEDIVHESISTCDHCGWHWHVDNLCQNDRDEMLCWKCEDTEAEENEE